VHYQFIEYLTWICVQCLNRECIMGAFSGVSSKFFLLSTGRKKEAETLVDDITQHCHI